MQSICRRTDWGSNSVVARSPDRATSLDRRSPCPCKAMETFGRAVRRGQEAVPQRGCKDQSCEAELRGLGFPSRAWEPEDEKRSLKEIIYAQTYGRRSRLLR